MRTPAWEDADLLYRPAPYEIDGTYRVEANGDQTLLSWARPTPWFRVGADADVDAGPRSEQAKLRHLGDLVEEHDRLWLRSPVAPEHRAWVEQVWRPWSRRWHEAEATDRIFGPGSSTVDAALSEVAAGLTSLREEAAARGLAVPDIGSKRLGFSRGNGWDSQRDAAYQAALRGRDVRTSGAPETSGPPGTPSTIEEFRREARRAVTAPRALGQEYSDVSAVAFLLWHGKQWVTPFPSLERARAYFSQVQATGIDFDYGAYFDVSDPQRPALAWEWLGRSPSAIAGSHAQIDLRYHAADAGADMSHPLIGRHGGGGGGGGGGAHGGHAGHAGHASHHDRRFFGGGGWDGSYGDSYAYPWWIYGATPAGAFPEEGESFYEEEIEDVTSGGYLRNPRRSLIGAPGMPGVHDDLRGAADVLAPGASGLRCELNFGSDMILRASICVDGQCYRGTADLSRLIHDIHARLHGVDVTEEVVGRGAHRHRPHHRRHHRRRREQQQQEEQEQEQEQNQGAQGGPPPYPYPYPPAPPAAPYPYPYPQPAPVAPIVVAPAPAPVAAVAPVMAPAGLPPLVQASGPRGGGRRHRDDGPPDTAAQTQQAVQASGELLIGALYNQHCQELSAGWLDSIGDAFSGAWSTVAKTIQKYKGPITIAATAVATAYGGESGGKLASQLTGPVIDAAAGSGDKKQQAQQVIAIAEQAAQTQPKIAAALSAAQTAAAQTAAAYHVTSTAIDALRGDSEAMRKVDQLRADAAGGDPAAQRALELVTLALQAMRSPTGPAAPGSQVGALWPWLGLGAAAGGAYWWWSHRQKAREQARQIAARAAEQAAAHAPPPPSPVPAPPRGSTSTTTTAGEIEITKADAVAAVQGLFNAPGQGGIIYFGYVKQRGSGHSHGRATVVDSAHVESFFAPGEMWAWYRQIVADPASYEFVALFDATKDPWPHPILAHEPPSPSSFMTPEMIAFRSEPEPYWTAMDQVTPAWAPPGYVSPPVLVDHSHYPAHPVHPAH